MAISKVDHNRQQLPSYKGIANVLTTINYKYKLTTINNKSQVGTREILGNKFNKLHTPKNANIKNLCTLDAFVHIFLFTSVIVCFFRSFLKKDKIYMNVSRDMIL